MKFRVKRDTLHTDTLYTIRGYLGNRYSKDSYNYRYIQFNFGRDPIVRTGTGYRADDVVCFASREQALSFLKKFTESSRRQNNYNPSWLIVETAPNFKGGDFHEVETSYGPCLKRITRYNPYFWL